MSENLACLSSSHVGQRSGLRSRLQWDTLICQRSPCVVGSRLTMARSQPSTASASYIRAGPSTRKLRIQRRPCRDGWNVPGIPASSITKHLHSRQEASLLQRLADDAAGGMLDPGRVYAADEAVSSFGRVLEG